MNNGLLFVLISLMLCIPSFDASESGSASSSRGGRRMSRFDRDNGRSDYYTKNNDGYSKYVDDKDRRDGKDKSDYIEKLLIAVLKENIDLSSRIDYLSYTTKELKKGLEDAATALEEAVIEIGGNIETTRGNLQGEINGLSNDLEDAVDAAQALAAAVVNLQTADGDLEERIMAAADAQQMINHNQDTTNTDLQGAISALEAVTIPTIPESREVIRAICVGFGPRGESGDTDDDTTFEDVTCSSGSTLTFGPNDENDIGDALDTVGHLTDVEDCEILCRNTKECVAFNWIIFDSTMDSVDNPTFSCEVYSSDVPVFKAPNAGFMTDAIVFCVLDDLPCIKGEIITFAGPEANLPDYLIPADGRGVVDDETPICGILDLPIDDHTGECELPQLNGFSLSYGGPSECQGLLEEQPVCVPAGH